MNDNSPLQVGSLYMNSDGSSETHNFRDNIIKEDSNLANNMNKSSSSNYYFPLLALLRVIPGNSFHEMLLREEILLKTARFGLIPTTISLMNVLLQSQLWVGTYVINLIMSMDGDQNKSSNLHRLIYLSMLEGKEYSAVIQSLDDVKQSISSNNSTISSNSTGIRTNSTKNSNNNQNKSMGTLDGFYNEYNERESLGKLNGLIAKLPPEDYAIGLHFSTLRKVLGSCIKCYTQLNKLADPTLIDQEKNRIVKILWLVNDIVKNNNLTVTTIFIQQYAELADRLKNIKLVIVALEWLINQGKIPSRELLAVRKALNDDNINYYWQLEDEYVHSSYFNYNKETVVPVGENLEKTQNGYDLIVNNDNDVLSNLLLNEPNKEKLTEGVSVDLSYLLVPRSIASQQTQDATIPKLRELEEVNPFFITRLSFFSYKVLLLFLLQRCLRLLHA